MGSMISSDEPASFLDPIRRRAAENPIAPALMGLAGRLTFGELVAAVTRVANHFDDRRLPRFGKVLLNVTNPDLRLVIFLAAIEYGLIPLLAQPPPLRGDLGWTVASTGREPGY